MKIDCKKISQDFCLMQSLGMLDENNLNSKDAQVKEVLSHMSLIQRVRFKFASRLLQFAYLP